MGRKPCCDKVGLKKGPWKSEEDQKLVSFITKNGLGCWRAVPKLAGLLRCGKSCRLRWTNYLRPDLKRGIFSDAEDLLILNLHATLGNRWSRIAAQLPGRTDNEIKNYWNTRLKKKLRSQGLDPATHLPVDSSMNHSDDSGGDTETAEWDEDSDTVLSDSVAVEHCSELPVNLEQEPVKVGKDEHSVAASGPSAVLEAQAEGDSTSQEGLDLSFKMEVLESLKSPRSTIPHCRSEEESEESSSTSTSKSVLDKESGRTESPARFVGEVEEKEGLQFGSSDSSINDVIAHQSHYCPMLLAASSQGLMQNLEEEAPWGGLQTLMSHTQSLDNLHVQEAASDYSAVFPGYGTYPPSDISFPAWSMDGYMGNPASDSYPSWNFGSVHLPASHPSQELQRLAAILDQI